VDATAELAESDDFTIQFEGVPVFVFGAGDQSVVIGGVGMNYGDAKGGEITGKGVGVGHECGDGV